MIDVCMSSAMISFAIWLTFDTALYFLSLRYTEGNIRRMMTVRLLFSMVMLLTLPLLLNITSGVC